MTTRIGWVLGLGVWTACGLGSPAAAVLPVLEDPWAAGQSRCTVRRGASSPLIVEWPAAERGSLERRLRRGIVAVRYEGCEMEVLRGCAVPDSTYRYGGFTRKTERLRIRDADELYANLPLSAVRLEGKLQRSGELTVAVTMVGMYEADRSVVSTDELEGRCAGATHVLTGVSVGAYALEAVRQAAVGAGVGLNAGPSVGGRSEAERVVLSRDGDPQRCAGGAEGDDAPPPGCGALLRLEVTPLGEAEARPATCPPPMHHDGLQCVSPQSERAVGRPTQCPASMAAIPGGGFDSHDIAAFCLDFVEVTVAEYRGCVRAGDCSPPAREASWPGIKPAEREASAVVCNGLRHERDRHPINCVTWAQAQAHCRARGARLPTEGEWAWAARGGRQAWAYPWGDAAPGPDRVNACGTECRAWFAERGRRRPRVAYDADDRYPGTAPTGSYPLGQSRFGPLDLAGNVAEWTDSWADHEHERRRVRGGSFWVQRPGWLRTDDQAAAVPQRADAVIGFRCAR